MHHVLINSMDHEFANACEIISAILPTVFDTRGHKMASVGNNVWQASLFTSRTLDLCILSDEHYILFCVSAPM